MNHEYYMELALKEAKKAGQKDEVPIGALSVAKNGEILASAFNQTIGMNDPTAHAEVLALRKASEITGNYRLTESILYVTIEPCIMCMGAILHARVKKLIFGAFDPKAGAAGSIFDFTAEKKLNHQLEVESGILEAECRALIQNFFKQRRN